MEYTDLPVASLHEFELDEPGFDGDRRIIISSLLNDGREALSHFAGDGLNDGLDVQPSDELREESHVGEMMPAFVCNSKPVSNADAAKFGSLVDYSLDSGEETKNHQRRARNAASASNSRMRRKWFLHNACQELRKQHALLRTLEQAVSSLESIAGDEAAVRAAGQAMARQLEAHKAASVWTDAFASELATLQPQSAPSSCAPRAAVPSRRGGNL
jgi:hypothetical protein